MFNRFKKLKKNKSKDIKDPKKTPEKKNKFSILKQNKFSEVEINSVLYKGLSYSLKAKNILKKAPKLISDFLEFSNSSKTSFKKSFYKDNKKIEYTFKKIAVDKKESFHTEKPFLLEFKVNNSIKKFYIKSVPKKSAVKFNSFLEMKGIQILKDLGYDVVSSHFAFYSKSSKKSFIVYDYMENYHTVSQAYKKGYLTDVEVSKIRVDLVRAQNQVNAFIKENYTKYDLPKDMILRDIYPEGNKNRFEINAFIDLKTKKVYFFDPWVFSESKLRSKYK